MLQSTFDRLRSLYGQDTAQQISERLRAHPAEDLHAAAASITGRPLAECRLLFERSAGPASGGRFSLEEGA